MAVLDSDAETCKQSLRGSVVVQYAYGWDILAETGGSGQPDSPPQSHQLLCVRWARGGSPVIPWLGPDSLAASITS